MHESSREIAGQKPMIANERIYVSATSVIAAPDRPATKKEMQFRGEEEEEGRASGESGRTRCAALTLFVLTRQDG